MNVPTNTKLNDNLLDCQRVNDLDEGLQGIAEGVAAVVGEKFFRQLVKGLCEVLDVRYAFVAELLNSDTKVRTLAFWANNDFTENIEFDLLGTPCEEVILGKFTYYPKEVPAHFPDDKPLAEMGIESYLGVPLFDTRKNCLGHLAVFHTEPFAINPQIVSKLQHFCARASVELARQQVERRLRASEMRLANVLKSAMDAIIMIDKDRRITLFNPGAEKMLLCPQKQAIDQCVDKFLCDRFRCFVADFFDTVTQSSDKRLPLWAPTGLQVFRSEKDAIFVEATLSPFEMDDKRYLTLILRDIDKRQQAEIAIEALQSQNRYLQDEIHSKHTMQEIIGRSPDLEALLQRIKQVAPVDTTVLITGETGTGKELVAKAIHSLSLRKDKLLVKLNCAALPPELLESELFGHEKGAFTGALQQRKGRFELADGGTLFLDEIGELSLEAQAKLLRALQEQEFERVGGSVTLHVNVRLVAATNRNLAKLIDEGKFREDLFYRLNVIPLYVPPLRKRRSDIPLLVEYFLGRYSRSMGKAITGMSNESMTKLQSYEWPGNIRELQNIIERAVVLSQTGLAEIHDSLEAPGSWDEQGRTRSGSANVTAPVFAGKEILTESERKALNRSNIIAALQETNGKVYGEDGAASKLGMKPTTLASRIKSLGISKNSYEVCTNFG